MAPRLHALSVTQEDDMRVMAMVMAAALGPGSVPTGVSFVLDREGGVIVPVTVGSLRDLHFLLDTGSTRSVVSEAIAQQLALRAAARTEVVSTAGVSMAVVAALPPTCLATQCVDNALAIVAQKGELEFGSARLDGILGGDVLSLGDFTLDYAKRRFEWGGGTGERRREDRLPMSMEDGRAIVTVPQTASVSLRLVADSGAGALVLFDTHVARSLATPVGVHRFMLQTLSGSGRAEQVLIPALRVGGVTWRNAIAAVVPRPAGYPETIDGVLPLHRFARVSFRRSESAVVVRH